MVAKKKRLTNKEKQERRRLKKELVAEGLVEPDKKRLNRKKFIEDTKNEWNERNKGVYQMDLNNIMSALGYMMAHRDRTFKTSLEAVGAAKVLKVAMKLQEFQDKLRQEGRVHYKIIEEYEYIKEIMEL